MEKLLTAAEVAGILNCHSQTVYRNRDLPCINIPGLGKRFKESELNKYLEQKSTFLNKDYPGNLPFKSAEPILSLGGDTCEMPKGKNKTRYNFGFGAIYQRKTKSGKIRWYLDYRNVTGKRIQKVAMNAITREEAKVALREEVAKAFDSEFRTKRKREKIKFKEFAELYIENYAKVNKKSWRGDLYRIEANMIPFFGTLELQEIDPLLIEKYRAERLKADVTKSTVNREITIMKKMFNLAIDWSFTELNPVQKIKLFSEKDRQKERLLTEEEEKRLLAACPAYVRPIIETALNTGMRRGEIFNLEWKQVDLKERAIQVVYTKSGRDRIIPINDRMHRVLLNQKQLNGKSLYVFPNSNTGRPFTDIKKSFKCACENTGIKDLRFHDLRHTFASRLVRAGVDLITVRDLLGHFSVRVTQRYTHTGKDQKQRAVDLLNAKSQKRPENQENLLHNCYIN
jgi:integrase